MVRSWHAAREAALEFYLGGAEEKEEEEEKEKEVGEEGKESTRRIPREGECGRASERAL